MTTPPPKPINPASNPAAVPETIPKKTNQKVLTALSPKVLEGRRTDRTMLTNSRAGIRQMSAAIRAPSTSIVQEPVAKCEVVYT